MKTICIPTITQEQEKIIIKHESTPIASVVYNSLFFDGDSKACKKIEGFYRRLTEKYSDWVNKSFRLYAERDYISDTHPRKKFRYKPYVLSYNMLYEIINDRFLGVEIQVKLTKDKNTIGTRQLNHLWDLSNGYLQIQKTKKR